MHRHVRSERGNNKKALSTGAAYTFSLYIGISIFFFHIPAQSIVRFRFSFSSFRLVSSRFVSFRLISFLLARHRLVSSCPFVISLSRHSDDSEPQHSPRTPTLSRVHFGIFSFVSHIYLYIFLLVIPIDVVSQYLSRSLLSNF